VVCREEDHPDLPLELQDTYQGVLKKALI